MAYRARGSFWRQWKHTIVLAVVILGGQSLSTWFLANRQIDAESLQTASASRSKWRTGGRRAGVETQPGGQTGQRGGQGGQRGNRRGGGEQNEAGADAGAQGTPPAPGDDELSNRWTLESEAAVERLDGIMQQRLEALAKEKGRELAELMPDEALRQEAIASGDLRSEPAQKLISEYSRILRELAAGE